MSEKSGGPDKPSEEDEAVETAASGSTDAELADAPEDQAQVDEDDAADDKPRPAAAGSARAAARRSGVRAGSTERKGTATPAREAERTSANVFARLARFVREVAAELRKVIWPARNQMVTYTLVVIVFVVFMVALVAGLDVLFARGVLAIFG